MRPWLVAVLIAAAGLTAAAPPPPTTPKGIDVMVLGAYHFANPGLDKNNIQVDTVLTSEPSGSSTVSPERSSGSGRHVSLSRCSAPALS